jgi:hypothetical protein
VAPPKAPKGQPKGAPPASTSPKVAPSPKAAGTPKAGGTAPKAGSTGTAPKGGSDFSDTAKNLPNFSGTQGHDLRKPEAGYGAAGGVYTGSWTPTRAVVL